MKKGLNKIFGLLGKDISYSFSKKYFSKKFASPNLNSNKYLNFDIQRIEDFPILLNNTNNLRGINVTIPYKEKIIDYLDEIDDVAKEIGAVNTIKITNNGKLKGYNTDAVGFRKSIIPILLEHHKKALILGTGGAAKAISYVLKTINIEHKLVSRKAKTEAEITYENLSREIINTYNIIINCTPLGTFPEVNRSPNIPYDFLSNKHILYDLIYNPNETLFLKKGKERGAIIKNGYQMLELQAEDSWRIWNENN